MASDLTVTALQILDDLHLQESRLLSWGMVDGSFDEDELEDAAARAVQRAGTAVEPDDALDWLEDRALLFRLPYEEGRFRTRVAEGVRLFARLRQIFPDGSWTQARELVADFRFATLPRRYPDRCIEVSSALEQLGTQFSLAEVQKETAEALLGGADSTWKLADFQVEAAARVLSEAKEDRSSGTIVCAGTGSGKTLAFYLPAFMHIAARMSRRPHTECLAIYPRIELLRDQLKTAISNARLVNHGLEARHGRALSVGALYGAVPRNAAAVHDEWNRKNWADITCRGKSARRCPYFDCPDCESPLGWPDEDIAANQEHLVCSSSKCDFELGHDSIRLTREEMSKRPPDILFATTEMLNRSMSNRWLWPLFGIGDDVNAPSLVLLDEVHTYGGVAGAQAALTLRRWRHLARARCHFVGLSATLAEAPRFMAQLVGLYPNQVANIEPHHLVTEGCEHILVLRGKPGTATLSTTIQSSMLLRRLLDASPPKSDGHFGERLFVFTDNLDVTNRLYFQLADAEGWANPRRRRKASHPPLASLRSSTSENPSPRFRAGQNWRLGEVIGHDLGDEGRTPLDRTSSQDSNVDSEAGIVVATASLEVGFDDPRVGGVIQHQAPHDPAAYVQRKGRAGRGRQMRPWTVVVLSDWGRDRQTYRSYEHLFSPSVPPRELPIGNRHVLRMQAALSFLDWITRNTPYANLWADLSGPRLGASRSRQDEIAARATRVLQDEPTRKRFAEHLARSLQIDADEAVALLWEPPRALLLAVLPTLIRRIERQWRTPRGTLETLERTNPLPDYIPRALFEDLNLPEVGIAVADGPAGRSHERDEFMPIRQALNEFPPGRVSRRFAIRDARDAHWVAPPEGYSGSMDLKEFCPDSLSEPLGHYWYLDESRATAVEVFRPHRMVTTAPPREIDPRSDARAVWHSQILSDGQGSQVLLPRGSGWRRLVRNLRFHTHVSGNPIEARRFTTGSEVRILDSAHQKHEGSVTYTTRSGDQVSEAALGYTSDVDGFSVDLTIPDDLVEIINRRPQLLRGQRWARFLDQMRTSRDLDSVANVFARQSLAEVYVTFLVALAEREAVSLAAARAKAHDGLGHDLLKDLISVIRPTDRPPDEVEVAPAKKRADDLDELVQDEGILNALHSASSVLSRPFSEEDARWLNRSVRATIGGALLGACQRICPTLDSGDLFVDLSAGPSASGDLPTDQVWITESTVGGSGFVEAIHRSCAEDPRRLEQFFEAELEPTDFESVDYHLRLLLSRIIEGGAEYDPELAKQLQRVRDAPTFAQQAERFEELLGKLRQRGISTSHAFVSALSLRLLRPGSSADTDRLVRDLALQRDALEARYGIELDDRGYAAIIALDSGYAKRLASSFPSLPHLDQAPERHALLLSLLWPRGAEVRRQALSFWNPFSGDPVYPDRLLLHEIVPHEPVSVSTSQPSWRAALDAALIEHGRATLRAPLGQTEDLRNAVLNIAGDPIEADSLVLYPRIRAYKRSLDTEAVTFEVPEAFQ